MLKRTKNMRSVTLVELRDHPGILAALRMSTAPPLARDRLISLAGLSKSLVETMERDKRLPSKMLNVDLEENLQKIADIILLLADEDIFPWLGAAREPNEREVQRAATIVADRLCGANADPIIRNAQERRQLGKLGQWLESRGYEDRTGDTTFQSIQPGMFAFRVSVLGSKEDKSDVNIPIDAAVMPLTSKAGTLPFMIEAKSAGDFTNTNKRRKEEAIKVAQLRRKHGREVRFVLFLCGYFDTGYLGYEAAEGIDWVWEHRIADLAAFGL